MSKKIKLPRRKNIVAFPPQTYPNEICMKKKNDEKAKLFHVLIKCHQQNRILNSFCQTSVVNVALRKGSIVVHLLESLCAIIVHQF